VRRALLVGVTSLLLVLASCGRTAAPASAPSVTPNVSPRRTLELLLAARQDGRSDLMRDYIAPARVDDVIALLAAVDEFLAANESLCRDVSARFEPGVASAIDQSRLGGHLDIFSRSVELRDERVLDDRAEVTFLVESRLPLRTAKLQRLDGKWRYDPGEGFDGRLVEAFRLLAAGMRSVRERLESGELSTSAIQQSPDLLFAALAGALQPGAARLPQPTLSQPAGAAP
jgi:hypothetical protein